MLMEKALKLAEESSRFIMLMKQLAVIGVFQLISMGILFSFHLSAANLMGPEGYGKLSHAVALSTLIVLFGKFGSDQILVRDFVFADCKRALLQSLISMKLVLSLIATATLVLALLIAGRRDIVVLLILLGPMQMVIAQDFMRIFDVSRAAPLHVLLQVLKNLVLLILLMIIATMEIVTPCMVAFAMLISSIIFITVQIPCVQHFLDWNPAFSLEGLDLWHIIRRTSPVAVGAICLQVIAWSPLIFLGFLGKAEDLAIFGLSSQFMFAYLNLLALIYRLIFPVICEASRTGDAKCFKQVEYLSPKILLFFLAASGLACLMAPVVLNFLRKEYLGVLPLMRAMFVFSSIIIWGEIFCVTLLAQNRMQEYIIPIVAGVLAVVLVNLWAIPLWGEWGAFLAFVIAELTVITGSLLFFMANRNSMLQDQGPLNDSGLDRGWKEVLWKRIR